jgi:hypothetical protein
VTASETGPDIAIQHPRVELEERRIRGSVVRFHFGCRRVLPEIAELLAGGGGEEVHDLATSPVQPVWWLAPSPSPFSPLIGARA